MSDIWSGGFTFISAHSKCDECKNYLKRNTCKAFPDGIPSDILLNKIAHTQPTNQQDNDIVFEPKD
jgi:hypothetical protein